MADDTEQLRAEIDQQRAAISGTVDQIENRVNPSRIVARRQDSVRRTLTNWKDTILGNDEADYSGYRSSSEALGYDNPDGDGGGAMEAARERASSAMTAMSGMPETARRQTQGNPLVAGAVALGVGWLVGSLMPQSEKERELARKAEPRLAEVVSTAKEEGQQMVSDLKEPAQDAVQQVKEAGREATTEVKDSGMAAAESVKDSASTT